MIHFFGNTDRIVFAVQSQETIGKEDIKKLEWLFGGLDKLTENKISSSFIGPRAAMITPWSTNVLRLLKTWVSMESFVLRNLKLVILILRIMTP